MSAPAGGPASPQARRTCIFVGAFRLTDGGLVLEIIMPGLDVERDIRPNCGVRFGLPPGGPVEAPAAILSGLNYALAWGVGARG